jgi:hypothetical protein
MELQLLSPQIIARLNLALGHGMIERLRFVQQAPGVTAPTRAMRPSRAVARPADLPEGELGDALARLYEGINSKAGK